MPRLLRRAAVLGVTANAASKRGAAQAQAAQEQAAEAAPPPVPEQAAPPVVEASATPVDPYGDLMKLKELLDAGALSQAEFDAEKQKILDS